MLKMLAFDVGHGNAIYFNVDGKTIMFDCADSSALSPARYIKEKENVNRLDLLVITHPHVDHIREIHNVDAMLRPKQMVCQKYNWQAVLDQAATYNPPCMIYCGKLQRKYKNTHPENIEENNLKLTHYYLDVDDVMRTNMKNWVNRSSIISILEYRAPKKTWKFLVTGDASTSTWQQLCENTEFLEDIKDIDVLVAPHHGGYSGVYYTYLKRINKPLVALVTYFDKRGEGSIDPIANDIYDNPDFFKGIDVNGNAKRMVCLGSKGSFSLEVSDNGDKFCADILRIKNI